MRQYRVIIWGLGNVGRAAVRMIGERQSVKLVAAVDNDPEKVGKDAAGYLAFRTLVSRSRTTSMQR